MHHVRLLLCGCAVKRMFLGYDHDPDLCRIVVAVVLSRSVILV